MYNGYNISCSGSIIFISVMKKNILYTIDNYKNIYNGYNILVALAQLFFIFTDFFLSQLTHVDKIIMNLTLYKQTKV